MTTDDLDTLPLVQRLALSYAPASSREAVLTLMLLDNRLAAVLRQRGENVLIAQMKLAWWRDRLGQDPTEWPKGEPLLQRLRDWPGDIAGLIPMVDGWESLLGEDLDRKALVTFSLGRAQAWCALADGLGEHAALAPLENAIRQWAVFDLTQHLSSQEEREAGLEALRSGQWKTLRVSRKLRTAVVLHGLARRAVKRSSDDLLDGPGAMLTALRLGLFGR